MSRPRPNDNDPRRSRKPASRAISQTRSLLNSGREVPGHAVSLSLVFDSLLPLLTAPIYPKAARENLADPADTNAARAEEAFGPA